MYGLSKTEILRAYGGRLPESVVPRLIECCRARRRTPEAEHNRRVLQDYLRHEIGEAEAINSLRD